MDPGLEFTLHDAETRLRDLVHGRSPDTRQIRMAVQELDRVAQRMIAEHKKANPKRREDLLDILFAQRDSHGLELSNSEILDEVKVFFLAGHETAANTLAWALYLIASCPDVEKRLLAEIDRTLETRTPRLEDPAGLVYTRAVIEETLRLYPPLYMLPRESIADDWLGRRHVPPGTLVFVSPWFLHRNPRLWRDPDRFQPERFLPNAPRKSPRGAFIPFGAGPRKCPGASFAMTEITILLAMILRGFRLRPVAERPVEAYGRLTLRPKAGITLQFDPRIRR